MGNSWFRFKQFKVEQQGAAMKVGTDGVLVGAMGFIPASGFILDIGSGTGVIALMAAQRSEKAKIHAIEIDPQAAKQSEENFKESPWSDRLSIQQISVFDYLPPMRYDAILCNPPFFINSIKNPNKELSVARHCNEGFSHTKLLEYVMKELLTPDGRFTLILPTIEAKLLLKHAEKEKIGIYHIDTIHSFADSPAVRYIIQFVHNEMQTSYGKITLYSAPNVRSEEYNKLMQDFYL